MRAVELGTLVWVVLLIGCILGREPLAQRGLSWWSGVCVAGALLGLAGIWFVRRRRAAYRTGSHGASVADTQDEA